MPKKDDAPELAVCDGCGMELAADALAEPDGRGLAYCPVCAERRTDDPVVAVHGRMLTLSELEAQAEDDEHLAAALDGDTVQDQIKAAKKR